MTHPLGRVPHPLTPDWDAYEHLQQRAGTVRAGFDLECVERALNRLLAEPERATSGRRLALRVERDARKHLRRSYRPVPLGDRALSASPAEPTAMELDELELAVGSIRLGVAGLDGRLRHALATKALGLDAPAAAVELRVGGRQLLNLANAAREELWRRDDLQDAFFTLRNAFERSRHLAAALCAPLARCWGLSA